MSKKIVTGSLSISVYVNCPHCGFFIDLLDQGDTDGQELNEEGYVLSQACHDGCWADKHKKFKVEDVVCSECKGEFTVKGLEW